MSNYVLPQVRIYQNFEYIPTEVTENQHAFVFGPSYRLWRYGNPEVKDQLLLAEFLKPDQPLNNLRIPQATTGIDEEYTKLFADEALCEYLALGSQDGQEGGYTVRFDYPPEDGDDYVTARQVRTGDTLMWDGDNSTTEKARITTVNHSNSWFEVSLDRGDAPSGEATFSLARRFNNIPVKTNYWTPSGNTITIHTTKLDVPLSAAGLETLDVWEAKYYVEFRETNHAHIGEMSTISSVNQLLTDVGFDIHPDDPLTYGAHLALLNSAGKGVYVSATGDGQGWGDVLEMARHIVGPYFLVPLTDESWVIEEVKRHVNMTSTPSDKRWRVAFVATGNLDIEHVFENDTVTGEVTTATKKVALSGSSYTLNAYKAKPGDKIDFYSNPEDPAISTKVIDRIDNANTVVLADATGLTDGVEYAVKIYRPATASSQSDTIRDRSLNMYSRRMYHVFSGVNTTTRDDKGNTYKTPGYFTAAAVAGLASALPPQQGLTNIELLGVISVPDMYRKFTVEHLNNMASGGTLLVTQDTLGGVVYVRHQLSTATKDGDINTTELSLTKNMDSVSYYFANVLSNSIGSLNVTPELLNVLRLRIEDGLDFLCSRTGNRNYSYNGFPVGPQLIEEGTELVYIEEDSILKGTVNTNININMPKPHNIHNLSINAIR